MTVPTSAVVPVSLPGPVASAVWRTATIVARTQETVSAVTLELDVPGWPGARAGQHVDVRLTAEDGYTAQRSYSLASPGGGGERIALTVQLVPDGEVSAYLAGGDDLGGALVGDQIELRGPIGGWFTWEPAAPDPVQLVAGGSGLVPLMSMLRTRALSGSTVPFRLLVSVRAPADELYGAELDALAAAPDGPRITRVWTRSAPPGWTGPVGRLDAATVAAETIAPTQRPTVFVCGPTGFVEAVADALVAAGHDPADVRTERFGASGAAR